VKIRTVLVEKIGESAIPSPLASRDEATFVSDEGCVIYPIHLVRCLNR